MTQTLGRQPAVQSAAAVTLMVIGGDGTLAAQASLAAEGLSPAPTIVRQPSFLHALGSIGSRRAGAGPRAVIGRPVDLQGSAQAISRAFAQLAPQAQLVLVAPRDQAATAGEALANGFHRWWIEPIDTACLLSVLSGEVVDRLAEPSVTTGSSSTTALEAADAFMIETLLRRRRDFTHEALARIQRHAGLEDAAFTAQPQSIASDRAAATVSYGATVYGHLHAGPRASRALLGAAAAWLGRWMALRAQMDELWDMALRDPLTGAWNRRYFDRVLKVILERAAAERFAVTLLLFDIDDFKIYNDRYGHGAGDEILKETAKLMQQMVRPQDVVARIGGDEFAVIFWESEAKRRPDSHHPQDVDKVTRRFRAAIAAHKFPKLADEAPGTLTISGGLASFPWDGRDGEQLLERADAMALSSKQQGKNVITFGPGALQMYEHNGVTTEGLGARPQHDDDGASDTSRRAARD